MHSNELTRLRVAIMDALANGEITRDEAVARSNDLDRQAGSLSVIIELPVQPRNWEENPSD